MVKSGECFSTFCIGILMPRVSFLKQRRTCTLKKYANGSWPSINLWGVGSKTCSSSEHKSEKNLRAFWPSIHSNATNTWTLGLLGLQEETAMALHLSYDQWDPCGEGEQLQVPRCKHLRGPDLDYTHSNTGQESQAKTVPSATAEEIQGLTSNPENFLFRGHRKCIDSVHLSVVWKLIKSGLQSSTESRVLSWVHLRVCSPLSAGHLPQTLQKQSC